MKVLLINGSPNEKGCTFTALSEVASSLEKNGVQSEIFWVGKKSIQQCIACFSCTKTGKCVFNDQVNELASRLDEFSGFVIGSPVYFAGAAGGLCSFLDRLFFSADLSKFEGKPAAAVVSCRRGGNASTFDRLNKYMTINNMLVVGSQYWNEVHGTNPDEVKKDLEGLQTMRTLGANMAWLIKCIEAGKKAGINYPVHEPHIMTNFIR